MAPFRLDHDELRHELPWLLMQNGPVTKYWRRDGFEEDIAEVQTRGFRVVRFDVSSWADEDAMYSELRDSLGLPDYMGMGFDSLADALTDLDVPEEGGVVVALDSFTETARTDTLLEVLARASRWWLLFGRVFAILLRTDDPGYLGPTSLGATQAQWNRREWLTAKRHPLT